MWNATNRRQSLVVIGLSALACASPARAFGAQQGTRDPWIALAHGEASGILELSSVHTNSPGTDALRFCRLEEVGGRLVPANWRTVATLGRWTGGRLTIAAQRLSSGAWAIVKSELPGGTRVLQYLVTEGDLFQLEAPTTRRSELINSVRLVGQKPDERSRLIDLGNPRIVEHESQVYLLGDSYLIRHRPDNYAVWVAPAKTVEVPGRPGRSLANGRIIAYAQNPRATKFGTKFVVAAQKRRPNTALAWGMPVRLYVSTDLENWKPFPAPADTLEIYDYDLCVTRHGLTLVGIVDTSKPEQRGRPSAREPYAPPLAMVTLVYDAQNESWRTLAKRADTTLTRSSEIKLLPVDSDRAELKLIERGADGRFTTKSVDEQ